MAERAAPVRRDEVEGVTISGHEGQSSAARSCPTAIEVETGRRYRGQVRLGLGCSLLLRRRSR